MAHDDLTDVGEGLVGAAGIALAFLTPMLRGLRSHWGLSEELAGRAYPGDQLVPDPRWSWTHGIEIEAPREAVWPWVAQIGQSKGGFYSYQWLENLIGSDIENADEVHPEWQALKVGDTLKLHKDMPGAHISVIEPGQHFAVHGRMELNEGGGVPAHRPLPDRYVDVSWLFYLEPLEPNRCRFVSRFRTSYSDDLATRLQYGPTVTEPVGFVMDRKMLLGLKERGEASCASRAK